MQALGVSSARPGHRGGPILSVKPARDPPPPTASNWPSVPKFLNYTTTECKHAQKMFSKQRLVPTPAAAQSKT